MGNNNYHSVNIQLIDSAILYYTQLPEPEPVETRDNSMGKGSSPSIRCPEGGVGVNSALQCGGVGVTVPTRRHSWVALSTGSLPGG